MVRWVRRRAGPNRHEMPFPTRKDVRVSKETFGQYLREKIREADTNSRQLAIAMDVSSSNVSHWLTDKRTPQPESCLKLAQALGVPPDEVLEQAGHRQRAECARSRAREDMHYVIDRLPESEIPFLRDLLRWRLREAGEVPTKHPERRPSQK